MTDSAPGDAAAAAGTFPVLPAPFDATLPVAYVEYHRRTLGWTTRTPGTLYRNHYVAASVNVCEAELWRSDRLWLRAQRQLATGTGWQPFSDRAHDELTVAILPRIARHGFARAWLAAARLRTDPGVGLTSASTAERVAAWWRRKADLDAAHVRGRLVYRPAGDDERRRPRRIPDYEGPSPWVDVIAQAWLDCEHVGWLTAKCDVIPCAPAP